MEIRRIERKDNSAMEKIVRECLIEFGGNREGLAWVDASLHDLYHYYRQEGRAYWVVEHNGEIVGGCGIAAFADSKEICELQKMYLSHSARGTGISSELLRTALEFAGLHYGQCYLETLETMHAAGRFYQKHGFRRLEAPLAGSEHYACDAWYVKELS